MKLNKKITVNNQEYTIISDSIILEWMSAGRGIIVVKSELPLYGAVKYLLGYNGEYSVYFTGYVAESTQIDKLQQRLLIYENSAVLANRLPIALQHADAEKVITETSRITGLSFVLEDSAWNKIIIPYVYNIGNGFALLRFLLKELKIANGIFAQYPSGEVYLGSHDKFKYGSVTLQLPAAMVSTVSAVGGSMPIIPEYRPGLKLNIGTNELFYITKTESSGENMRLNWSREPFK